VSDWTEDVGHGFNRHGYLVDDGEQLAGALVAWLAGELAETDGPAEVALQLVLRRPDGEELAVAGLPSAAVRELKNALHRDYAAGEASRKSAGRADRMADLIAAARREHGVADLGNLVAYALNHAAGHVYLGAVRLVHGRPGSWEADIVMRMAEAGGAMPPEGSWERLAELFRQMGEAQDDGGQVLANAFGYAARELGGIEALAAGSVWAADVWNLAKALNYDDPWEPWG
jgi:hypothetical protein